MLLNLTCVMNSRDSVGFFFVEMPRMCVYYTLRNGCGCVACGMCCARYGERFQCTAKVKVKKKIIKHLTIMGERRYNSNRNLSTRWR
jgi:hypothetical protein